MKHSIVFILSLVLSGLCAASWSVEPDDPALVGLWLLDEGEGDSLVDSSGNENDAIGDFDWGDGKFGGGIVIAAGTISVPTSDSINSITEALTVAAWFRIDADSNTGIRRQNGFLLEDQSDTEPIPNSFSFRIWTTSGISPGIYGTTELEQGKWYHLAGTYDGEVMRLYVNGVEEQGVTDNVGGELDGTWDGDIQTPANELQLKYGAEEYFGAMDEIVLFNRALSADEIKQLARGWANLAVPVDRQCKLSTTWGGIKELHR
jgi:hypothetical protein